MRKLTMAGKPDLGGDQSANFEKSEAFTAFTWEKTDKAEALRRDAGL